MKGLFARVRFLRVFVIVCQLLLPLPLAAVQATLTGDAHLSQAQPGVNAGSLSNLNVGGGYTALVQFDLGVLPAASTAAQVARATLRLYCNRADTPGSVSVQAVYGSWTETAVTYATAPVLGTALTSTQVSKADTFVTFDVTSQVQGWINAPGSNFGLALSSAAGVLQFDSKENDQTAHLPQLEIVLASGSATSGSGNAGGVAGPTGATGTTGAAGTAGATGAVGVRGATGSTGATGPAGAAGAGLINFRGAYSSTTNYSNGDVVQFAGSTYLSATDGNHGNMPGLSASWGLLASVGANGATGAAGVTGATGQQGPPGFGVQGATGQTGATGATGSTGRPGLVYQGTYSSVANYATGDVVLWNGASYVSLLDSNHGNTPGQVSGTWGVLTAQGPVGTTGSTGLQGLMGATGALGPVGPPGERGQAGPQGIAGQAGAQGLPGATGATGLQGPMGATGVAGPVGMSWQGAYSAAGNYSVGQAVLWQGAGWVSLVNGNHGNTPDASPWAWAMFAAAGASGATGATGFGVQGAPGATGAAGVNGRDGASGATGATGAPGLIYQGTYSSGANYALGDVVLWNGSSYASLIAGNRSNTPGTVPGTWGLLSAQGAVGPAGMTGTTGPTGFTGATGAVGPAGPQGIQGAAGPMGAGGSPGVQGATGATGAMGVTGVAGPAGPAGAQGLPGATGATGAQGIVGPAGPVGPVGMSFTGPYSSATNYAAGQGVLWQGSGWVSLTNNNAGNAPDSSPSFWARFAAAGAIGATGATGVGLVGATGSTGATGPTGSAGLTGATGATGAVGMRFLGAYSSASGYAQGDAVSYNGASYVSLVDNNHGQTPGTNTSSWALLAAQGSAGLPGTTGQVGATGPTGATGLAGSTGATGPIGSTGAQGAIGINFHAGWSQTARYATNDAVTFAGTTYLALISTLGQEPDQYPQTWAVLAEAGGVGPTGVPGATGSAATVAVGSVTTLPAGAQATVTNSGTSSSAVLNFGIPQGAAGTGSGGGSTATVPRTFAFYHSVSFSVPYNAVNSTANNATETAPVLAWVPQSCTATRLDVYSQQTGTIKVTLRLGTATTLNSTALTCTAATNTSCTGTGAVPVTAGQFMDLLVQNASGTAAPVWMALECDP